MMRRIPKRYGEYQQQRCPFCGKQATQKNEQQLPVCQHHRTSQIPDQKCACGSWLDLSVGKYGPYFRCYRCGNKNFQQVLASGVQPKAVEKPVKTTPKEITITTDDVEYFD